MKAKLQTVMEVLGLTGAHQSNLERKSLLWNRLHVIPYKNSNIIRWLTLGNSESYLKFGRKEENKKMCIWETC